MRLVDVSLGPDYIQVATADNRYYVIPRSLELLVALLAHLAAD